MNNDRIRVGIFSIICYLRDCENCELCFHKAKKGLTWCDEIPIEIQLPYAHKLISSGDKKIIKSLFEYMDDAYYAEAISLIRSGGVKYE